MVRVMRTLISPVSIILRVLCAGVFLAPALSAAVDISVYPNATLDLEAQEARNNHPLVSSSMKKVNGVVFADEQQFHNGWLDRKVYLLPPGHDSDQVFQFFTRQFDQLGVKNLFKCEQFSCGDSNFWANNIFNIARLYGLDKTQFYSIGTLTVDGREAFYSTYVVRRGNRRVYALVDVFSPEKAGTGRVLFTEEFSLNRLPVDSQTLKMDSTYSRLLAQLKMNKSGKFLVLLESTVPESLKGLEVLSGARVKLEKAMHDQLAVDGIDPARLVVRESLRPVADKNERVRVKVLRME